MARKSGKDRGILERPKGSGIWYARVVHQGRQFCKRAASKSHAREVYYEMRTAIRKGAFPPEPGRRPALFEELLEDYREAKRREGKAVMGSDIGFTRLLERFGARRVESITTGEVEAWRNDLLDSHTAATVNRHLTLLCAILRRGVKNHRLEASAVPEIKKLAENNKRLRYLTDDEEHRLHEALPVYLHPLVVVAIHTGMRRGEMLGLVWDDIDFVSGTIWVRQAKSGEERRVPINQVARETLLALRRERGERRKGRVVKLREMTPRVFAAPQGGFLANLNRAWYPALKRAALEGLHFHDLRHTFASRLAMAGADLYRIQTLLGHKTPAMTLRYAHLSPDYLRAAVDLLAAPGPKPWAASAQAAATDE